MSSTSHEAISAAVRQALTSRGPMTVDELADVLVADGVDLGSDPEDLLEGVLEEDAELVLPLLDDRWASLPGLLDGRVFTHRLSAPEVEHDLINYGPDLAPMMMLTEVEPYQRLTDGSPVLDVSLLLDGELLTERGIPASAVGSDGALLFESGRFDGLGVAAGDLVGLRVTTGGFELSAVAAPGTSEIVTALIAGLDERDDEPEMLDGAIWTLCADDRDLFRQPVTPLSELLEAGGLAQDGDYVAHPGFDFPAWRVERRIEGIQSRYDLTDNEALAVLASVRLYEQTHEVLDAYLDATNRELSDDFADLVQQMTQAVAGPSSGGHGADRESDEARQTVRAALEFLAEPAVAAAVLAEIGTVDDHAATALGLFAESVEPMAPRGARPALRWLRAVAHERLGDVERAEQTYQAAESLDPSWPLTLISLARYAGDRGDARRALALLRRAGAPPEDEQVQLLEQFQPTPRPDIGRNQPCWCGSGRKYKVCHLHREQQPLAERAAWLYQKAGVDLLDGRFAPLFIEAAEARSQHWDSSDALMQAMTDALVADAVLFEGGAFDEFVRTRGSLLPSDELLLAQQWLLLERSVHEVVSVRRGHGMTMRDVRTGHVHDVRERTASKQVKVGELYCGRVVPAGDTTQIFGGLEPVAVGSRDALITLLDNEPDPVDLVMFLSGRFAPPLLRNTEGESLVMCDATLRVADPAALSKALDDEFDPGDDAADGTQSWYEHVITQGMERIRANLELTGDELNIHANSEARFERVLATIRQLDPSATVLDETREPAGDLKAVQRLAERRPAAPAAIIDPASDPAIAAAMTELTAKFEAAWLDESIPALAGHTPRECADDPTRRPDLIRLLDSFPQDDGQPGMMSPARLREALGLG